MYLQRKREVVILLAALVFSIIGLLILTETGAGITGAVIGTEALEPSDLTTIANGSCMELVNGQYTLAANVSRSNTCFSINNDSITLDCQGYRITYRAATDGAGVNNTGGYDNIVIQNCDIVEGSAGAESPGINFKGVTGSTIQHNRIFSAGSRGHGIILEDSSSNVVDSNNITVGKNFAGAPSSAVGIILNGSSLLPTANLLINNNITAGGFAIQHFGGLTNTLSYNNSLGTINWTLSNLTTSLNLSVGTNIFLDNNNVGLADLNSSVVPYFALNTSARIEIKNLTYQKNPDVVKRLPSSLGSGTVRCDNFTGIAQCNISYDPTVGIAYINVTSFSNYSTEENDPPRVTILYPTNGSNVSLRVVNFSSSVRDNHSAINATIFIFNNGTNPFNYTATNYSGIWNVSLNTALFTEGLQGFTVFANDTYNNINNTQFVNFTVDRSVPNVTINFLNNPVDNSNFSVRTSNRTFNASIFDIFTQVDSVYFWFDNGTGKDVNITATNRSGNWLASYNVSGLVEGRQGVRIVANDTVNNVNDSYFVNFTVDLSSPNVTLNFLNNPVDNSNFSIRTSNRTFNASVFDALLQLDTVYFWFDNGTGKDFNITGTNRSGQWSASYNVSGLAEERQGARIVANDTVNNVNSSYFVNFTVDRSPPSVNISFPANGASIAKNQSFNATITDNLLEISSVIFQFWYGNQQVFNRTASNNSGNWNVTVDTMLLSEGPIGVTIFANDSVGNLNGTQFSNFTIDNVPDTANAGGGTDSQSRPSGPSAPPASKPSAEPISQIASPEEIARSFEIGESTLSITPGLENKISTYALEKNYKLIITNNLDEKMILSGRLKAEAQLPLPNEENAIKRIKEELLLQGEADPAAIEKELSILKLLENIEILQVFKTKLAHLLPSSLVGAVTLPLIPTGKHIEGNLLKDLLLNAEELQEIVINPGQTVEKEIKIRQGLRLDKKAPQIVFSSGGKQVLLRDVEAQRELLIGTAVDVDPKTKKLDFYIIIPPTAEGDKETFSVEMNINAKAVKDSSSPLQFHLFGTQDVFSELYGPYKVNLKKGALLAVQYDASALPAEYEVVGKVYKQGTDLVSENKFEIKG